MRHAVTIIGTTIYILFGLAVAAFATIYILPAKSAENIAGYTCDDVRWALANLSKDDINKIKERMTAEQLAAAKACKKAPIAAVVRREVKE